MDDIALRSSSTTVALDGKYKKKHDKKGRRRSLLSL